MAASRPFPAAPMPETQLTLSVAICKNSLRGKKTAMGTTITYPGTSLLAVKNIILDFMESSREPSDVDVYMRVTPRGVEGFTKFNDETEFRRHLEAVIMRRDVLELSAVLKDTVQCCDPQCSSS